MVIKNYTEFKRHHLIHQNCLKDPKTVDWINVVIYVSLRNGFACSYIAAKLLHMLKSTKQNYDANICN